MIEQPREDVFRPGQRHLDAYNKALNALNGGPKITDEEFGLAFDHIDFIVMGYKGRPTPEEKEAHRKLLEAQDTIVQRS